MTSSDIISIFAAIIATLALFLSYRQHQHSKKNESRLVRFECLEKLMSIKMELYGIVNKGKRILDDINTYKLPMGTEILEEVIKTVENQLEKTNSKYDYIINKKLDLLTIQTVRSWISQHEIGVKALSTDFESVSANHKELMKLNNK